MIFFIMIIFSIIFLTIGFVLMAASLDTNSLGGMIVSILFIICALFIIGIQCFDLGQRVHAYSAAAKSLPRYEGIFVEKPSGEKVIEVILIKD